MDNHRTETFVEIDTNMNTEVEKKCLLCFSKIFGNNSRITSVEFRKLFQKCSSHVPLVITTETPLLNILGTRDKYVTICKHCWDVLTELSHVAGQIAKFEKEMNNLTLAFSMGVLYRRSCTGGINNGQSANKQKIELDISSLPAKWFSKSTSRNADEPTPVVQPSEQQSNYDDQRNINVVNTETGNDCEEIDLHSIMPSDFAGLAVDDWFSDGTIDLDMFMLDNTLSNVDGNLVNISDEHDQLENNANYCEVHDGNQMLERNSSEDSSVTNESDESMSMSALINTVSMPRILLERVKCKEKNIRKNYAGLKKSCGSEFQNVKRRNIIGSSCHRDTSKNGNKCKRMNSVICRYCKRILSSNTGLKMHLRTHTGERPYKCSICMKKYKTLSNLKRHEKIYDSYHQQYKSHKCSYCEIIFATSSALKFHLQFHPGTGQMKPYKCKTCKRMFTTINAMHKHLKIHVNKSIYKCSICKKGFDRLNSFILHKLVHTPKKPHKCAFCKKTFTFRSRMKLHETVHTKKRPYKCSVCRKQFARASDLVKHEHLHLKEKTFKCPVCGKAFNDSEKFKKHTSYHTRIKRLTCSFCPKTVGRPSKLTLSKLKKCKSCLAGK